MKLIARNAISLGLVLLSLVLGLGAGAGVKTLGSSHPHSEAANPSESGDDHGAFSLEVDPVAEDGELEFDVVLTNRVSSRQSFKYIHQFVSDTGETVSRPSRSRLLNLARQGLDTFETIRPPKNLKDGYYVLRVTAAGANARQASTSQSESFFAVTQGELRPVSSDEWFKKSRAMEGR